MADEQIAESSTAEASEAAVAAVGANDFAAYQANENARELAAKGGKATVEAPPPSEEAVTTETAAGAEPAVTQEIKKPKTGEDRKLELKAEIDALLRQRAELQGKIPIPGEKVADPPAAKPVEPVKGKAPIEPKLDDFATFAEYQAADRKYVRDLVAFETQAAIEAHQASASVQAQNKVIEDSLAARQAEARETFADFDAVALAKTTPITKAMDGWILKNIKSPGSLGMHVLYRLGEKDGAEGKRIAALDAYDQVEELNKLRDAFKKTPAKTNTAAAAHTSAPPPATEISGRETEPANTTLAALKTGDFGTYQRLQNAADLAKLRRN